MQISYVPCAFVIEKRAELYLPALWLVTHELDCVIVTVNYRLAPEICSPASLEDNCPALQLRSQVAREDGFGVASNVAFLFPERQLSGNRRSLHRIFAIWRMVGSPMLAVRHFLGFLYSRHSISQLQFALT